MSDDLEPTGSDAEVTTEPAGDEWEAATNTEPSGVPTIRRTGHAVSDKVRELFKTAAQSVKEQIAADPDAIGEDEYEIPDVEETAPQVAAVALEQSRPQAAASAQVAAAPAPSLDPAVLAKVQQLDARAADLDARDKAITDRQKAADAGDFGKLRETYFDKGGAHAIVELIKQWTGATTVEEIQEEVADLVTELSGHTLGVSVPSEIRTRLDAKRALKGVKSHQAKLDARETALTEKQAKAEETANIQRAVYALDTEVRKPELVKQFPFLTVEPNAGELIFEVVDAQLKRDGSVVQWMDAAKRVNDYLETKWREEHGKRAHLLTAPPAAAGGAANGSRERPQGDPQGIRRSQTLSNANTAPAPTPSREPVPPANGKWSAEDHRARTKAKMRAAFKPPSP